jgi:hypothetical protein
MERNQGSLKPNDPRLLTVADLEHSENEERWFSIGLAEQRSDALHRVPLVRRRFRNHENSNHISPGNHTDRNSLLRGEPMNDSPIGDEKMPVEIDFRDGVRGLHHIPPGAKVFLPASIERGVWEYFAGKAQQKGIDLSELLTDVLKRDIEINEALK